MGAGVSKWDNGSNVAKATYALNPSTYGQYGFGGNLLPTGINPPDSTGFYSISSSSSYFSRDNPQAYYHAYRDCAPLQAIINKKAQASINGVIDIYNASGKARGKVASSEQASRIRALIRKPNWMQTEAEFRAQAKVFESVFGFNVQYVMKPVGMETWRADEVWNLPANLLTWEFYDNIQFSKGKNIIKSCTLTDGINTITLNPDNIYIMKDFVPSFETAFFPQSRIRALSQQIYNSQVAYGARGSIIDDRGALGIISSAKTDDSGTVAMTPTEKKNVRKDFQDYGLHRGKFKYIITNAALTWQSIGFSTKDLMLFEEINDDIMRLCDAFGVNYRLLSSEKSASYADVNEFKKELYQDTIIPEGDRYEEFWNSVFETAKYNIYIDTDYSHVAILQEDKAYAAKARYQYGQAFLLEWEAGLCTLNDWRVSVGEDALSDPQFNMYIGEYTQWYLEEYGVMPPTLSGKTASQVTEVENNNSNSSDSSASASSTPKSFDRKVIEKAAERFKKYSREEN